MQWIEVLHSCQQAVGELGSSLSFPPFNLHRNCQSVLPHQPHSTAAGPWENRESHDWGHRTVALCGESPEALSRPTLGSASCPSAGLALPPLPAFPVCALSKTEMGRVSAPASDRRVLQRVHGKM